MAGLIRRRLHTRLPIFFAYLIFELTEFLVLLALSLLVSFSLFQYRVVLVSSLIISTFLKFGIVYEISSDLLLSYSMLTATLGSLLRWGAALLLLASSIASILLFRSGLERVERIFRTLDFCWSAVVLGMLLVLLLFARLFHISWRSYTAGVVVGFGVFAAIEMATSALRSQFGIERDLAISVAQMSAYHVSVVIWVVYLFLPERSRSWTGAGLPNSQLEFWDQELQRMVRR